MAAFMPGASPPLVTIATFFKVIPRRTNLAILSLMRVLGIKA
jgi:hypothetical protein